MHNVVALFKRELAGYFVTPVAYVFIVIFLVLTGLLAFQMGGLYERGLADLQPFFVWHPWLYLFLIPAIAMRLWAEERKLGTIEVLMTLPVTMGQAVVGKFLAAWAFTSLALALTFPTWVTVAYLGDPDDGVILSGYLASLLLAGGYLAVGAAMSALTRNQVIAFVLAVLVIFIPFMLSGLPPVLEFLRGWAPLWLVDVVASASFLTHYAALSRGVLDLRDLIFFVSVIGFWLFVNALVVDWRKSK